MDYLHTCSKDLHSVVFTVADENVSVGHNGYTLQAFEFTVSGSPASKGSQERTIGMEDLNAVVAAISHKDVTLVIHSHASEKQLKVRKSTEDVAI